MDRTLHRHGQKVNININENIQKLDIICFAFGFRVILVRTARHKWGCVWGHARAAAAPDNSLSEAFWSFICYRYRNVCTAKKFLTRQLVQRGFKQVAPALLLPSADIQERGSYTKDGQLSLTT